jgi:hypothetical protein
MERVPAYEPRPKGAVIKRDRMEPTQTLEARQNGVLVLMAVRLVAHALSVPCRHFVKHDHPRARSVNQPHLGPFPAPLVTATGRAQ